jgi:hypothetical protein
VPLHDGGQPPRHGRGIHEGVGQEQHRPHQDLHRHHRLGAFRDEPEVDADEQQRDSQQEQQAHRGEGSSRPFVPSPAESESG